MEAKACHLSWQLVQLFIILATDFRLLQAELKHPSVSVEFEKELR